jgi:xanthine dehydrogenase accessory factor
MNISIYQQMSELEQQGESFAVCTIVDSRGSTPRQTGSKMVVKPNGEIIGTVGGGEVEERVRQEGLLALTNKQAKIVHYQLHDPQKGDPGICGGEVDVFIEPICQAPKIIVIGLGHVGKSVAFLAKWTGFRVAVSDDRAEMNTLSGKEMDECWIGPIGQISEHIRIDEDCYIVLTTRNAELDIEGLPGLLNSPARYVGVIGSKRRWTATREGLEKKGIHTDQTSRVHTPVGLAIGAETPEEIAISILAEIIEIRRKHGER